MALRNGDPKAHGGHGVLKAVTKVYDIIAPKVERLEPWRQAEIDKLMSETDGTPYMAKLGANAILGVSEAVAVAAAEASGLPRYAYPGGVGVVRLPIPMIH